jgi:hypothetical protein
MAAGNTLSTAEILQAFSHEISVHGGRVSDAYDDGERLFARSTLPSMDEVKAADRVQGGVALKACGENVWVHPYVFRLVCQNGAIMAQTVASHQVTAHFDWDQEDAVSTVREAVRVCCAPEVFMHSVDRIRSATDISVDSALNLLPLLTRLRSSVGTQVMQEIMGRFFGDEDRTRFGLMNAVTSVGRDTGDPETRWNLEELGGAVPMDAPGSNPKMPAHGAARRDLAALVS